MTLEYYYLNIYLKSYAITKTDHQSLVPSECELPSESDGSIGVGAIRV
jgi:hypothetical protein